MKFMRWELMRAWGGALGCVLGLSITNGTLAAIPSVLPTGSGLRIATYNINADTGSDYFNTASESTVQTVLAAMGAISVNGNSRPLDVIGLEELQGVNNSTISPTLATITNDLNDYYGAGTYAYDATPDPTDGPTLPGNGPSGLIYNTKTVTDLGASLVGSGDSSGSDPRQPIRYALQVKGYGAASNFFVYVEHSKASGGTTEEATRANESVIVRENADALPVNSHIIYTGDLNLAGVSTHDSTGSGSAEYAYQNLVVAGGGSLKNSSGGVVGTAGAVGQAYDPLSPTNNFVSNINTYEPLFTESATDETARFDFQLISTPVETGSSIPGVQLVPNSQLSFGNSYYVNGSNSTSLTYTSKSNSTASILTSANYNNANAALSGLSNRQTVLTDLTQLSDHLPVISDYALYLTPGDANGDGIVNGADLAILTNGQANGLTGWTNGDFNGDGIINQDDFALFQYGAALLGSMSTAPEPGAAAILVALGLLALNCKR